MSDNAVAAQLRQLTQRYGREVVDDPGRCADLLHEVLGDDYGREIFLIKTSAEEGIPGELISSSSQLGSRRAAALEARLSGDKGFSAEASRWAVETWAAALGVSLLRSGATRLRSAMSIIAAAALAASAFSPWGLHFKAFRIGADILWTPHATVHAGFVKSIGAVALLLALVALLGLVPRRGWFTTLAGVGGLLIFVLFLFTHSVRAHFAGTRLDFGVFLLLCGSLLALPAVFVGSRSQQPTADVAVPPTPPATPARRSSSQPSAS